MLNPVYPCKILIPNFPPPAFFIGAEGHTFRHNSLPKIHFCSTIQLQTQYYEVAKMRNCECAPHAGSMHNMRNPILNKSAPKYGYSMLRGSYPPVCACAAIRCDRLKTRAFSSTATLCREQSPFHITVDC